MWPMAIFICFFSNSWTWYMRWKEKSNHFKQLCANLISMLICHFRNSKSLNENCSHMDNEPLRIKKKKKSWSDNSIIEWNVKSSSEMTRVKYMFCSHLPYCNGFWLHALHTWIIFRDLDLSPKKKTTTNKKKEKYEKEKNWISVIRTWIFTLFLRHL